MTKPYAYDSGNDTINNLAERAWWQVRDECPKAGKARGEFQTRWAHIICDQLQDQGYKVNPDRVRQRILKVENRERKPITIDRDALDRVIDKDLTGGYGLVVRDVLTHLGLSAYLPQEESLPQGFVS